MKLKKKPEEGKCCASRCKKAAEVLQGDLGFCDKHWQKRCEEEEEQEQKPAPIDTAELMLATQQRLKDASQEHSEDLQLWQTFQINSQEDYEFAEQGRNEAKAVWDTLEQERKSITQPINAALKKINDWFKGPKTSLEKIQRTIEQKMKEARAAAKQREEELLQQALQAENPQELMIASSQASLESSTTTMQDRWVFEVTNADEIPRSFMVPDLKAIGAVVAARGEQTKIPGIRVWNDPIVKRARNA